MDPINMVKYRATSNLSQGNLHHLNISSIPVSLLIFDSSENYSLLYINDHMLDELGYESQEDLEYISGNSLLSTIHPDDCSVFTNFSLNRQDHQSRQNCRCRLRKKDLKYLWYEIEWIPLVETGDQSQTVCLCNEISELIHLETENSERQLLLQDSHGQLETVIENLPGGWHICQLFDNISMLYASDGLCQICGYSRKEIQELFSNKYIQLIHKDDRQKFAKAIEELAKYPHNTELEYRLIHRNGSIIWVTDKMKSSRNREGKMYAYAVVTEIDKWQSEWQKARAIVHSTPYGVVIFEYRKTDGRLTIKLMNDTASKMMGYSRETFEKFDRDFLKTLVLSEDFRIIEQQFLDMIDHGKEIDCEFRFAENMPIHWAHMTAKVIEQHDDIFMINSALMDFTEKKEMSQQLSYQNYCLERIDSSLSSGIIIKELGLDGKMHYISKNIVKLLGYPLEDANIIFDSFYKSVIHPDDYEMVSNLVEQHLIDLPKHFEIEFRMVKKDGSVIWVKEAADRLDDFFTDQAYLIVFTDITQLKQSEIHLRRQDEEYRIALLHSMDIICRYSIPDRTVYFPEEIAIKYDIPAEVENMPYQLIKSGNIHRNSVENYLKLFETAERGETCTVEIQAKGPYQEFHWFSATSTVIFDHQHTPDSAVVSLTDISEQKQSEKTLNIIEEKDQLFRIMVESTHKMVIRYDFNSDLFEPYGSLATSYFNKMDAPYNSGRIISPAIFSPESLSVLYSLYLDMKKGIPKGYTVARVRIQNSKQLWFECSYNTIFDSKNIPQYSVIFCEDITAQRENELVSRLFQDTTRPGSKGIVLNLEYNLTTDKMERLDGEIPPEFYSLQEHSYSNAVMFTARTLPPEQQDLYISKMSREALLTEFKAGRTIHSQEILVSTEYGPTWVEIYSQMFKAPYSDDTGIWISCRNINEEKHNELQLVESTQMDSVTGLYNRSGFMANLQNTKPVTVAGHYRMFILIDVDGFGQVNAAHGQIYGDQVLRELAQTLKLLFDEGNLIARLRGDDFAIYTSEFTDMDQIQERLKILMTATNRELKDGLRLSICAGVTVNPKDGTDIDVLYEKTVTALYNCKMMGQNKYLMYSDDLEPMNNPNPSKKKAEEKDPSRDIYIRTFGYFDIFVNGKTLFIQNAKAKELLALLVDRRGGYVTPSEIISALWEEESVNKVTLSRCRKVAMVLRSTLSEYGLEDLMESQKGARRINTSMVTCDLYNYLSGKPEYAHLFTGSYMLNYSWGELSMSDLERNMYPLCTNYFESISQIHLTGHGSRKSPGNDPLLNNFCRFFVQCSIQNVFYGKKVWDPFQDFPVLIPEIRNKVILVSCRFFRLHILSDDLDLKFLISCISFF